jgi:ubiquinone/menaquinone biosynthesis C-methylase UbiE
VTHIASNSISAIQLFTMKPVQEVAVLFDAKAPSWNDKYAADGPLAYRVTAFSSLLAGRLNPGAAVLDFGGGTGAISSALARQGFQMTVCDLSEGMLAAGKQLYSSQGIDWVLLPKEWKRLPFGDRQFDAVIASSVFEYLDNVENVLSECGRVLRRHGKLVFSVPNPRDPMRRLERILRPLAILALQIPLIHSLPKIGNYLRYLQVSRARFSEAQWQQKAAAAGFESVEIPRSMPEPRAHRGMMFLLFDRYTSAVFLNRLD